MKNVRAGGAVGEPGGSGRSSAMWDGEREWTEIKCGEEDGELRCHTCRGPRHYSEDVRFRGRDAEAGLKFHRKDL